MSGEPGTFEIWVFSLGKAIYELVPNWMLTENISSDGSSVVDSRIVIVMLTTSGLTKAQGDY